MPYVSRWSVCFREDMPVSMKRMAYGGFKVMVDAEMNVRRAGK
jgi:hypothetical protein